MKLRYVTTLVSVCLMSSTVGATEVYNKDGNKLIMFGKLAGMHYLSGNKESNGDRSHLSYGFRGESQINQNVTAYGQWEYEAKLYNIEDSSNNSDHAGIGFAGLSFGNHSSFDYGRNYGILYDVGAWTNMMPAFSSNSSLLYNFLSGRATGVATYRNSNLFGLVDGLAIALQYQGQNANNNIKSANGDGYGLSMRYNLGNGVAIGGAYANSKRTIAQNSLEYGKANRAEAYSIGMKYDANSLYIAALYSQTHHMTTFGTFSKDKISNVSYGFANKAHNIELVAQYALDFNLRPSIGYVQSRGDGLSKHNKHDIQKYIEVGTSYSFDDNMVAFIDYRINLMGTDALTKEASINADNIVAVGMTYLF